MGVVGRIGDEESEGDEIRGVVESPEIEKVFVEVRFCVFQRRENQEFLLGVSAGGSGFDCGDVVDVDSRLVRLR